MRITDSPEKVTGEENRETEFSFSCLCGRIFRNSNELAHHRRRECGRLFPCPLCQSRLSTKGNLKTHIVTVHKYGDDIHELIGKVTPMDKKIAIRNRYLNNQTI